MATKKAIWAVVGYTDSCPNLTNAIETIESAGGHCMWITHDQDKYEHDNPEKGIKQGDPKKIHYHVACGWSKRAPDWVGFVEILKAAKLVCPGKRGSYDPSSAHVESPQSLHDYFLHWDKKSEENPYKHRYEESELHMSEGWCVSDYVTYEAKRKQAAQLRADQRKEDAASCAFYFDLIRAHDITEFCLLVDMVCSQYADKLPDLLANSYPVKAYLDSRRAFNIAEQKRNTAESKRCEGLNHIIKDLKAENAQLREDLQDALDHERDVIERCRCMLENLGETAPEWMVI